MGSDEDGVKFALGTVVYEQYDFIYRTEADPDLLRVPRVEDVEPVLWLFAEMRRQCFFTYSSAKLST